MKVSWTENDLEILRLAAPPPADFECPRPEQTEYFGFVLNEKDNEDKLGCTMALVTRRLAAHVSATPANC